MPLGKSLFWDLGFACLAVRQGIWRFFGGFVAFFHLHKSGSPLDGFSSVAVTQAIHGYIQVSHLGRVFEHIELLGALDQVCEAHAQQSDEHTSLVEAVEEFLGQGYELVIEGGVGNAFLKGMGIEI